MGRDKEGLCNPDGLQQKVISVILQRVKRTGNQKRYLEELKENQTELLAKKNTIAKLKT